MYIKDLFSFRVLLQSGPYNLFLSVLFSNHQSSNTCVSLFYRPPSSTVSIFDHLFYTLQSFYFSTFLLLGDFNVNFCCNSSDYLITSIILYIASPLHRLCHPTHVHPNGSKSLIDLAFLSDSSKIFRCEIISPLGSSDHHGISLVLNQQPSRRNGRPRLVWIYSQADFNKARHLIRETDWDNLLKGTIDERALLCQQTYLEIMEKCIPRKILPKNRRLPWITYALIKLIRNRNAAFRRAKKSGKASDEAKYRKLRNKFVSVLRSSKRTYFTCLNTNDKNSFGRLSKLLTKKSHQFLHWYMISLSTVVLSI